MDAKLYLEENIEWISDLITGSPKTLHSFVNYCDFRIRGVQDAYRELITTERFDIARVCAAEEAMWTDLRDRVGMELDAANAAQAKKEERKP